MLESIKRMQVDMSVHHLFLVQLIAEAMKREADPESALRRLAERVSNTLPAQLTDSNPEVQKMLEQARPYIDSIVQSALAMILADER